MNWLPLCFFFISFLSAHAQSFNIELVEELSPTSAWQEYLPDSYSIGDSLIISVGLASRIDTTEVKHEVIIRAMDLDGLVIYEKYQYVFGSGDLNILGYVLPSFYGASTIYNDNIYVATSINLDMCDIEDARNADIIYHFNLEGELLNQSIHCQEGYQEIEGLAVNPSNDSLYIFGAVSQEVGSFFPFLSKIDHVLEGPNNIILNQDIDASISQLHFDEDEIYAKGNINRFNSSRKPELWEGRISQNGILIENSNHYMLESVLKKEKVFNSNERATFITDKTRRSEKSSIMYFKNNIMQWNFYQGNRTTLDDLLKINDEFLVLRSDFRDLDFMDYKIVLHHLVEEGYEIGVQEYIIPKLKYTTSSIRIKDFFFVFTNIEDRDIAQQYINGEIDGTDHQFEATQVLKFKINE